MDFYVNQRVISVDFDTLPSHFVGDNTDYVANFIFDEEWEGKEKTARFIQKGMFKDVLLENDKCTFPLEVLKSGFVDVGVYAGQLRSTTPVRIPVIASILDKDGVPTDPTPDVYTQLMEVLQEIRDSGGTSVTIKTWTEADTEETEGAET